MGYGELTFSPVYTGINKKNGQFLKGHIPFNKGKKWDECFGKRAQKRMAKGWKNLDKFRPKQRPDTAGRCRKMVVGLLDNGQWMLFKSLVEAAEWLGGIRENIGRCCRMNKSRKVCKHDWRTGCKKGSELVNTDHRYKGIRWYFESDNIWIEKIG